MLLSPLSNCESLKTAYKKGTVHKLYYAKGRGEGGLNERYHTVFTSRLSGRGNRISPVLPSVSSSALSESNRLTYGHETWYRD